MGAYSILDPELGYTQGMNSIAALILIGTKYDEEVTFAIFEKVMRGDEINWRRFYTEGLISLQNTMRTIIEWLNAEHHVLKRHLEN